MRSPKRSRSPSYDEDENEAYGHLNANMCPKFKCEKYILFVLPDEQSNSIATIVKHLHGNMLSRWTDFLNTDGEKSWRDRDGEFTSTFKSRHEVQQSYTSRTWV